MKPKHFLSKLEHDRIHAAITAAEAGNSGDIVVYVASRVMDYPLTAAHDRFSKLNLATTEVDNNLLILIAPASRTFAVVGGNALHSKVGQAWWDNLSTLLARHFREGRYTDGLVAALEKAGEALRKHFPADRVDRTGQKDIVEE